MAARHMVPAVRESQGKLRVTGSGKVMECKSMRVQKLTKIHINFLRAINTCISLLAYLSKILIMLITSRFGDFSLQALQAPSYFLLQYFTICHTFKLLLFYWYFV